MAVHSTPNITGLSDAFTRLAANVYIKYPSTATPSTTRSQPIPLYVELTLLKPLVMAITAMNM